MKKKRQSEKKILGFPEKSSINLSKCFGDTNRGGPAKNPPCFRARNWKNPVRTSPN